MTRIQIYTGETALKKLFLLFIFFSPLGFRAQSTVGLILKSEGVQEGYVLFAPLLSHTTYLIDKCGRQVHSWKSAYFPNQSVYLLPDGDLLRTSTDSVVALKGSGGAIEKLNRNSKVVWSYSLPEKYQRLHHDICPLPNGNILAIVCDKKPKADVIKKGRDPHFIEASLWSEKIIELKPKGKKDADIVWEWSAWDHLIQDVDSTLENYGNIQKNAQLININFLSALGEDWLHFNSIDYNADLDQILISVRNFSEIFIIDHSTSRNESATHAGGKYAKGGDLLYRWGNPSAYNSGKQEDQKLYRQHNATWIKKGLADENKILVFNNGLERPDEEYSSVDIIDPPIDDKGFYRSASGLPYLPDKAEWTYTSDPVHLFYSRNISGAQRLPNGNTLICEGAKGIFFEVDKNNTIVWKYINPVQGNLILKQGASINQNQVFRCTQYPKTYPAFKKFKLKPLKAIESDPLDCISD